MKEYGPVPLGLLELCAGAIDGPDGCRIGYRDLVGPSANKIAMFGVQVDHDPVQVAITRFLEVP